MHPSDNTPDVPPETTRAEGAPADADVVPSVPARAADGPTPSLPPWKLLLARHGVPLASCLTALIVTIRTHGYFIRPYATPVSMDEGYIAALCVRMLHGHWLPYVDGVSQRGPVLYWLCALAMKLGGEYSWLTIRVLALTMSLSMLALVFLLARKLFSDFAASVAVLFATFFFTYELNPWDGVGYNGEIVAIQFVLGSMLAMAHAQTAPASRRRTTLLAISGACAALAGLSKQTTNFHVVPTVSWLIFSAWRSDRKTRVRDLAAFGGAFVAPYILVVGLYAATGHLKEFVYYFQRYGREIFMAPLHREYMRDKLREQIDKYYIGIAGVSSIGVFALARATRSWLRTEGVFSARLAAHAAEVFLIAQATLAVVGACFTWRFFPHYFVQVFPLMAIVAGYAVSEAYESLDERDLPTVASAFMIVAGAAVILGVANSALHRNVITRRETDRWYQPPEIDPVVRYVVEKTDEHDSIFVWGFRAETYISAHRFPASRFVYTVYPSGVVPWFQATREEEERRTVPGSRELLLSDLERWRPELVIDAGRSMNGRYMYNYPMLRNYLDQKYCFMRYVDGEPVYRRRHGDHCPPADY